MRGHGATTRVTATPPNLRGSTKTSKSQGKALAWLGVTWTAMSEPRIVHCVKLQKDLPGLESPPWPGALGQRIYDNVSAQAWKLWEDRQKMILNEYRLLPWQ